MSHPRRPRDERHAPVPTANEDRGKRHPAGPNPAKALAGGRGRLASAEDRVHRRRRPQGLPDGRSIGARQCFVNSPSRARPAAAYVCGMQEPVPVRLLLGWPGSGYPMIAGWSTALEDVELRTGRSVDPAVCLAHGGGYSPDSARSRLTAALIRARWVNACGKLPSASPAEPISSANRPTWLA